MAFLVSCASVVLFPDCFLSLQSVIQLPFASLPGFPPLPPCATQYSAPVTGSSTCDLGPRPAEPSSPSVLNDYIWVLPPLALVRISSFPLHASSNCREEKIKASAQQLPLTTVTESLQPWDLSIHFLSHHRCRLPMVSRALTASQLPCFLQSPTFSSSWRTSLQPLC